MIKCSEVQKSVRGFLHGLDLSKFPGCVLGEDITCLGLNLGTNPWISFKTDIFKQHLLEKYFPLNKVEGNSKLCFSIKQKKC